MAYVAAMISIGMSMTYAGTHEDMPILMALGILLYCAGIYIGNIVEDRTDKRIKELEEKLKEV